MQRQIEATVFGSYGNLGNSFLWPHREVNGFTWHSERITNALRKISEPWLGGQLTLSSYRHIAIAIGRRYLGENTAGFTSDTAEDAEEGADEEGLEWNREIAHDLQAAHSRFTAERVYGRQGQQLSGTVKSRHEAFREASLSWHLLLGFDHEKHDQQPVQKEVQNEVRKRLDRWRAMRKMNFSALFREIYGNGARYYDGQEELLQAITCGDPRVLGILSTGSGKSSAFLVPAKLEYSATTIVVAPLLSLIDNHQKRCDATSISNALFKTHRPPTNKKLIFVTPETVLSTSFLTYLRSLAARNQLD